MSNQYYIPEQDKDISLPAFKADGKPLILPAFICGVKIQQIESKKSGEIMQKAEFEFEIHDSAEKLKEITIFKEDENGNQDYKKPSGTVNGSVFVGKRVKGGELWRNLTKSSGRMNRILTSSLPNYGIKLKEEEVEIEGQKFKAVVIPDFEEKLFLGKGVFIQLGIESYVSKRGNHVQLTKVKNVIPNLGKFHDEVVVTNSLKENTPPVNPKVQAANDSFSDITDIDEDSLPF